MSFKDHNYTVSPEAKQGLLDLFAVAVQPHPSTIWARKPQSHIDASGRPTYEPRSTHVEGLSHALIQLARNSDLGDWMPNPTIPMYLTTPGTTPLFYNPPDLEYLRDAATVDDTPWEELQATERQLRLKELSRIRGWRQHPFLPPELSANAGRPIVSGAGHSNLNLSLPSNTRRYYHNLRLFHHIPLLPGCRRPHSLTTSVGVVLEAIGTGHLYPDGAYLSLIAEPNKRKSDAAKDSARYTRTYGNHAHTPYIAKEWRALPHISKFTQADVDYACRPDNYASLHDLAEEAAALNPSLILPPTTTQPVSGDHPSYDATPTRAKPHIDLVPSAKASASAYHYKGRDVTKYILEAHDRHYHPTSPETFPALQPLADRAQLPLYMLQRLATREYVRRLDEEAHNHA